MQKGINRRTLLKMGAAGAASAVVAASGSVSRATLAKAPAAQSSTHLKIMVWGRPDTVNWDYLAFKRAFPNDAKQLTVEPIIGGSGDPEVAQKFRLMLSAGGHDLPDVIRMNLIEVPEFATSGVLTDLSDWMKPYLPDMIDSAQKLATFEGKQVAVPAQLKPKVWFYRQDLFEKAGINPDNVKTMDDFVTAAKQFHEKEPKAYIHALRATPSGYFMGDVLTSFAPITYYDQKTNKFQVSTNPAWRTLFEILGKLHDPAISAPVDDFSPDWSKGLAAGTVASSLGNEWMSSFLPGYAPDQKGLWSVHAWPTVNSSNQGSDAGGAVWVIPKQAKNAKAAFDYLAKVYLTKEGSLADVAYAGLTPYVKSARQEVVSMPKPEPDPANKNALPWPPDFFGKNYFPVALAAEEKLAWISYDPASTKETTLLGQWAQRFVAGQADVDGAVKGLQGDLTSQIGDPWQS